MKNLTDLRGILIQTIDEVRNGKIGHKNAAVIAGLANAVIKTAVVEQQYLLNNEKSEFLSQTIEKAKALNA